MSPLSNTVPPAPFVARPFPATEPKTPRFTRDGGDSLERHLAHTCDRVLEAVQRVVPPRKLEAILLGGGYGRGEGGVLDSPDGEKPYNDLEFYVCVRGNRFYNRWRYGATLHHVGEALSSEAEVEVEFNIISMARLRASPISMFSYDLVERHRWLLGRDTLLQGCDHHRRAETIPLAEATRLLMNRFSGMLFAIERMEHDNFTGDDADFVGRNLAKVQLALGDAVLCALGQYHWSSLMRHERLQQLEVSELAPWMSELRRHHAVGLKFKLHPFRHAADRPLLSRRLEELRSLGAAIWLWLEHRRLGHRFSSTRDYAFSRISKCPESPAWRNLLLNLKTAPCPPGLRLFRAPREQLLTALPLLLWEFENPDRTVLQHLQRVLRCPDSTRKELTQRYTESWQLSK